MKTKRCLVTAGLLVVGLAWLAPAAGAQAPPKPGAPSLLKIEVTDQTLYVFDGTPLKELATQSIPPDKQNPPKPLPKQRTFATMVGIGDIASINGDQSAKGTVFTNITTILCKSTQTPGYAIADADGRTGLFEWTYDIYQVDNKGAYTELGTVRISGMAYGQPPPGAPADIDHAAYVVVGGTGAFAGVHGFNANNADAAHKPRLTWVSEDPAYRRVNGGGLLHVLLYLYPAVPPQVIEDAKGPQVFHAGLMNARVSPGRPAVPGEALYALVKGLGPLHPSVPPGEVFPNPPAPVLAPVAVSVDHQAPQAGTATGLPGATDTYRVDFSVPNNISAGLTTIRISVAWMWGPEVSIPIQ